MAIYFVSLTVRWSLQAICIIYTSFLACRIFLDWIRYLYGGRTYHKIIRNVSERRIKLCAFLTCIRKCSFNDRKNWTSLGIFFTLSIINFHWTHSWKFNLIIFKSSRNTFHFRCTSASCAKHSCQTEISYIK